MTTNAWLRKPVAALFVLGVAGATILANATGGSGSQAGASAYTGPVAITDPSGDYFTVAVDSTQPGYGAYTLALPGVGLLQSSVPCTVNTDADHDNDSDDGIVLVCAGTANLDATAKLDPVFGPGFTPSGLIAPATVRITGYVDPRHHLAALDALVNGKHHLVVQLGVHPPVDATLKRITGDLTAAHWADLYQLTMPAVRADVTAAQFVAGMTAGATGTITAATAGTVAYTTVATGLSWATVPISVKITNAGVTTARQATAKLVYRSGGWYLYTMTFA